MMLVTQEEDDAPLPVTPARQASAPGGPWRRGLAAALTAVAVVVIAAMGSRAGAHPVPVGTLGGADTSPRLDAIARAAQLQRGDYSGWSVQMHRLLEEIARSDATGRSAAVIDDLMDARSQARGPLVTEAEVAAARAGLGATIRRASALLATAQSSSCRCAPLRLARDRAVTLAHAADISPAGAGARLAAVRLAQGGLDTALAVVTSVRPSAGDLGQGPSATPVNPAASASDPRASSVTSAPTSTNDAPASR